MAEFCGNCGRLLDKKWNKRMRYGEAPGFCNNKCKEGRARKNRPKEHKKFGVAGTTYGTLGTKFLKMRRI